MRILFRLVAAVATVLVGQTAVAEPLTLIIARTVAVPDSVSGQAMLSLKLTPDSGKAFARFTGANVGKIVDLSIDGAVMMSPRIVEPIRGGEIMVSGTFKPGEVERIAERISAGDAKVEVDVKSE
ncbi:MULTISPECIES: SecDF P1 head subdomain-containing protein [Mesorhizobium]|uniref:SecDF P1 head subdomain-containing protein n=1 Tax=Mesorhizobium australicum TaxID=536018 RepID=UPI00333A20CB